MDWDAAVRQYEAGIFSYCYQFFGSRAEAEDAAQETFLKAMEKYKTLRNHAAFKSWLYTIARNTCLDRARWWKRFLSREIPGEVSPVIVPQSELALTLRSLIAKLPQRQREIFILRHFHDFSTEETAEILGVHSGTVKTQLKRAVDMLKTKLGAEMLSTTELAPASVVSEKGNV